MFFDPIVNLLFLSSIELIDELSALNRVIFSAIGGSHHVVKGDDDQDGQNVDTEEGCVAHRTVIVLHEDPADQTIFVFHTEIEHISELFHQSGHYGHLVLMLWIMEWIYREVDKLILIVHISSESVRVSSVQHNDVRSRIKKHIESVSQARLFVYIDVGDRCFPSQYSA